MALKSASNTRPWYGRNADALTIAQIIKSYEFLSNIPLAHWKAPPPLSNF